MNRVELVDAIALKSGDSKSSVDKILRAFTDVVEESLAEGNKVQLVGFGTFEVSERAARKGHNPSTGKSIDIKACKVPKFKAGKAFKDIVNR